MPEKVANAQLPDTTTRLLPKNICTYLRGRDRVHHRHESIPGVLGAVPDVVRAHAVDCLEVPKKNRARLRLHRLLLAVRFARSVDRTGSIHPWGEQRTYDPSRLRCRVVKMNSTGSRHRLMNPGSSERELRSLVRAFMDVQRESKPPGASIDPLSFVHSHPPHLRESSPLQLKEHSASLFFEECFWRFALELSPQKH